MSLVSLLSIFRSLTCNIRHVQSNSHPSKFAVATAHRPRNIQPLTQLVLVEAQYETLNNKTNSKKYFFRLPSGSSTVLVFKLKPLTLNSTSQTQRRKQHFGSAKLWHSSFCRHYPNRSQNCIPRISICFRQESRTSH